jgi:hypothetical protein
LPHSMQDCAPHPLTQRREPCPRRQIPLQSCTPKAF